MFADDMNEVKIDDEVIGKFEIIIQNLASKNFLGLWLLGGCGNKTLNKLGLSRAKLSTAGVKFCKIILQ